MGGSGIEFRCGRYFPHPSTPVLEPTQLSVQKGRGPFTGVKRPEHGVDHPSIISAEAKESVELHLYSLSVPYALIYGKYLPLFFTFTLPEYFSMTKGSMLDILCILTVDLQNI